MVATGSVASQHEEHPFVGELPSLPSLVSPHETLAQRYQVRPFFVVKPWTPDADVVVKYVNEFLETKPWSHDEHPIPRNPNPYGPLQNADQMTAHWHAHHQKFVESLLPSRKEFGLLVPIEGEGTSLECAIIDTPAGAASKSSEIHSSLAAHSDAAFSDDMFDALDEFYIGGGEAWVFQNPEGVTTEQPFSLFIRRWPARMLADWKRWIALLYHGIHHVVDSAVMFAVLEHAHQSRTNGNRYLAAGWDDAEQAIRYSHSEGRRRDGTLVPTTGPTSPLVTKFLAHAFVNPSMNRSPDDGMDLHVLNFDARNAGRDTDQ